ncbi:hypothetical protein C8034_v004356 [Colletotrichum sidae]|uniref:Uncharacterized protein n=1 Tax=Colletotrichum sidae TaxID=1347389 RepID=A0A4V3I2A2_9PEZI|nr:hypothetical protein C8034_v004356 [Colletotrichum sidae]
MSAIPIILCGKTEKIGRGVIEGLKPEYEVVHFITTVSSGEVILPALLTGQTPPSHADSSSIGSGNYAAAAQAIVLGAAFDEPATAALKKAVSQTQGARSVPWLRHDASKPSPPIGPEYGKMVIARVKETMARLEKEGKLGDGNRVDQWY